MGVDSPYPHPYFAVMPPRRRTLKDSPAKLAKRMSRRWRIVLIRSRGEVLVGTVEAADAQAVERVAAMQFNLDDFQSRKLLARPCFGRDTVSLLPAALMGGGRRAAGISPKGHYQKIR